MLLQLKANALDVPRHAAEVDPWLTKRYSGAVESFVYGGTSVELSVLLGRKMAAMSRGLHREANHGWFCVKHLDDAIRECATFMARVVCDAEALDRAIGVS